MSGEVIYADDTTFRASKGKLDSNFLYLAKVDEIKIAIALDRTIRVTSNSKIGFSQRIHNHSIYLGIDEDFDPDIIKMDYE